MISNDDRRETDTGEDQGRVNEATQSQLYAVREVAAVPSSWQRRWGRIRSRPLQDPLSLGVLSLTLGVVLSSLALWSFLEGRTVSAVVALLGSTVSLSLYVTMALRAWRRESAAGRWHERRNLRLRLTREEARTEFLTVVLSGVYTLDRSRRREEHQVQEILAEIVIALYWVLERTYSDVAVVLALETENHFQVLHSETSKGSRWREIEPGKRCRVEASFAETLHRLALDHRALSVRTASSVLQIGVLSSRRFEQADQTMFGELPKYLRLITDRWEKEPAVSYPRFAAVEDQREMSG